MGSWLKEIGLQASTQLSAVASGMELETVRTLIVVRRGNYGSLSYLEIKPKPLIVVMGQKLAKAYRQAGQTDVEVGDYMAYVSRRYALHDIAGDAVSYLIDADPTQSPPQGGINTVLVPEQVLEGNENFWNLILREQG